MGIYNTTKSYSLRYHNFYQHYYVTEHGYSWMIFFFDYFLEKKCFNVKEFFGNCHGLTSMITG